MNVLSFITSLFEPATKLVDEIFTSKEEKAKHSNELAKIKNELAKIQNEISTKIVDYESQIVAAKQKIIYGEISGNWLQRSWRPILMLTFGGIIVYQYFFAHVIPGLEPIEFMPDRFWSLMELGIGGYVAGRSLEKMVPQITRAVTESKEKARIEKGIQAGDIKVTNTTIDTSNTTAKEMKRMARKMRGEERKRRRAERRARKNG